MAQVNFISATKLVELLKGADGFGQMNVRVLSSNQLALGIDPLHPSSVIDLSKEIVRSIDQQKDKNVSEQSKEAVVSLRLPSVPTPSQRLSRTTGKHYLKIKGIVNECRSLKELLAEGLKAIETRKPGTLEKLSKVSPRSKRIVSKDPNLLFEKMDLVDKYTEKLDDVWWYGTNNSAQETAAWLKRAAELANLEWGSDVIIS